MKLVSWSVMAVIAVAVFTSIPSRCVAVTAPQHTPEQLAAFQEATSLLKQINQLYAAGKYSTAIPLAKRVLELIEKVVGANNPYYAMPLTLLANLYKAQGNYQQAQPLYEQALALRHKTLPANDPSIVINLQDLGDIYREEGKYQQAQSLLEQAKAIALQIWKTNDPRIANILNSLGMLYRQQGNYQQAQLLYKRALEIRQKATNVDDILVANSFNNLAELYEAQGKYKQAQPLFERALKITENAQGKNTPLVANSLNNLGDLYYLQGKYQEAQPLYQSALKIRESVLGAAHPDVATSLNSLGNLYYAQGDYRKAQPLDQRALEINEKAMGVDHPLVAISLNNLAELYEAQGNYQQAEPLLQHALTIREKAFGAEHPDVATSLNNLAALYYAQDNYQQAQPFYLRALAINEKALGADHPDVANTLSNLAALYDSQGQYQQAQPLYERALAIRKKVLSANHPLVALSLNNLAWLYSAQGNYQQAKLLYEQALGISKNVIGVNHPLVANSLNNLAWMYTAQGDISQATSFLNQGLTVEEYNLALNVAIGSELQKQYYIKTILATTDEAMSLSLQSAPNNPDAARLALTTVLRRKGRVLDAVANSLQILRTQLEDKPEAKKLFDQLQSVLQQQSGLISKGAFRQTADEYKTRLEQLEADRQKLEAQISSFSAEFRIETQPVELKTIRSRIPKDAALVEIVQYRPFNAKANKQQRWGKLRYAATVVRSDAEPKWVDLGEAEAIDNSVSSLRKALSSASSSNVQQLARALDQQVMTPIRPLLGNARQLIISPDGQLTLIPFEALRDEQDQYLIQRYAFSYLTSGRDLLRFDSAAQSRSEPVVLANIDYDKTATASQPNPSNLRGSLDERPSDWATVSCCTALQDTQEANTVKSLFPNAKILLGAEATKTALQQIHGPEILHLATHGLFFPDREISEPSINGTQQLPKFFKLENPLLRSGLALAGFNNRTKTPVGGDNGVLTAMEVAGLDLRGTQLVVLSACETGLGDVKVGDGVYGLRRALVIAGSQSQVLSLWSVGDEATSTLMVKYYQNLKAGQGRHEALQAAQRELLNTPKYQHPFFWAAFVPSGEWTPLHSEKRK